MSTKLEEIYKKRLLIKENDINQQNLLNEAFADLFKPQSANVQKFNQTIDGLEAIARKYNLNSLITAVANAKSNFETAVMSNIKNKANQISMATAFIANMQSFIKNLATITTQLPSVRDAIKQNAKIPLETQLVDNVAQFKDFMHKQYQNASGLLGRVSRLFQRTGTIQQLSATYKFNPETFINELLKLTPAQFVAFTKENIGNVFVPETGGPSTTISQPTPATGPTATQQPTQAPPPAAAKTANLPTDIAATIKGSPQVITDMSLFNPDNFTNKSKSEVEKNIRGLAKVLGIKL
jgi:hypothetical protein